VISRAQAISADGSVFAGGTKVRNCAWHCDANASSLLRSVKAAADMAIDPPKDKSDGAIAMPLDSVGILPLFCRDTRQDLPGWAALAGVGPHPAARYRNCEKRDILAR
jgi:hypothetical protein